MAAEVAAAEAPAAQLLEVGRYRVTLLPDGSAVLARAAATCETCGGCGCGTQAPPVQIPAYVVRLLQGAAAGEGPPSPVALMKAMTGRG